MPYWRPDTFRAKRRCALHNARNAYAAQVSPDNHSLAPTAPAGSVAFLTYTIPVNEGDFMVAVGGAVDLEAAASQLTITVREMNIANGGPIPGNLASMVQIVTSGVGIYYYTLAVNASCKLLAGYSILLAFQPDGAGDLNSIVYAPFVDAVFRAQ